MKNSKNLKITLCALFAALTAIFSQIQIPLPNIPINLALLAVFMAGAILGAGYGTTSMIVYVLLGAVGVPVFAGFKGGLGTITGATGGYIVGYIVCAFIIGIVIRYTGAEIYNIAIAIIIGLAVCYTLGTVWFIILTGNSLISSLSVCVLPFLPGDAIKIGLASILSVRLRNVVNNTFVM